MLKKYTFVFPLVFILGLAYWRYTYILNPNFAGDPIIISIKPSWSENPEVEVTVSSIVNIKSILIYWTLFFLGNIALFVTLFSSFEKVKPIGFLYILISILSVLFFAFDALWFKSPSFFGLGSVLKNFLLSPMFTAITYIMVEYFYFFGKPS